jgi:uncharacterized SAM-dependent methyltransferase
MGDWSDWLPWAPRIDLWHNANSYRGTLPPVFQKDASLEEVRAFQRKVTIFGGVPSVALLESSMSDDEFETFLTKLFEDISPGDRFILGVSDTTPPDARFDRLLRITERVREQGQLPLKS